MKGLFITIEGIDGTGKSTQVKLLSEYMSDKYNIITTREPGGTDVAEKVRELLLSPDFTMDERTELLLMEASRSSHVKELITPALKSGKCIICERSFDSTTAYQGYARDMDLSVVSFMNEFAMQGIVPDMTIILDMDPEISYARVNADDTRTMDRMELEGLNFQKKVRNGYLKIAEENKDRVFLIDIMDLGIDAVHEKIKSRIQEKF